MKKRLTIILSVFGGVLFLLLATYLIVGFAVGFDAIHNSEQFQVLGQIFGRSDDATNGNIGYFWITLYISVLTTLIAYIFGIPLGVLLALTHKDGLKPNRILYHTLSVAVNIFRAVPFLLLLIFLIPFTKTLVGASFGTNAIIVPLVIAAIPFVGRIVEQSLRETDKGVIEAAQSLGASTFQIIVHVYLKESIPSLVRGIAISMIMIIGYSTMSYIIGGGGLGQYAYSIGYIQKNSISIILWCIISLLLMVGLSQAICNIVAKVVDKRK